MDYSKCDNMETDSDDEAARSVPKTANAPKPQQATQQAPAQPSQASTSTTDKSADGTPAASENIKAVITRCTGDKTGPKWSTTTIASTHPIFEQQQQQHEGDAPLASLLGIPLIFCRLPSSQFDTRTDGLADGLDNNIMTRLNIDPETGLAPKVWQSRVGTVLVARLDKKPLPAQHLEAIWMYCDYIVGIIGRDCRAPRDLCNREAFEMWWANIAEYKFPYRGDWRELPTPYQV